MNKLCFSKIDDLKPCASKEISYVLLHCSDHKLSNAAKMIQIRPVHPKILYLTVDQKKKLVLRKQGTKFGNIGEYGHLGHFKGRQLCKYLWYSVNILHVHFLGPVHHKKIIS